MEKIYISIILSLFSAAVGYLVSVWRQRGRPWITPLEFWMSTRLSDQAEVGQELAEASEASWFMDGLPHGRARLSRISAAARGARDWLDVNEDLDQVLQGGAESLKDATSDEQAHSVLRGLMAHKGVSDLLMLAVSRGELKAPAHDPERSVRVRYFREDKEYNGCFAFHFGKSIIYFGTNFNSKAYRLEDLTPVAELVSRLEREKLCKMLQGLEPIWSDQESLHRKVYDLAHPIKDLHSRWLCRLYITNFGASPFLLFPRKATLQVSAPGVKDLMLDCYLIRKDEKGELKDTDRKVMVIKPGETRDMALASRQMRGEMEKGDFLHRLYREGKGKARAVIYMKNRDTPWKSAVKTDWLPFRD